MHKLPLSLLVDPSKFAGKTVRAGGPVEAVVEGVVKLEELSVDLRKRLLVDEGKHEEAEGVTEPETRVTFMATGAAFAKGS